MGLASLVDQEPVVALLQRSLQRGRLGHAYLFTGDQPERLENIARNLAKALNCPQPVTREPGGCQDGCDHCSTCRRIDANDHPDVTWVRPESKLRVIRIAQVRELVRIIGLKPAEAPWKVAILMGADRLNESAANAFLKTLEEPPGQAILILLSSRPQRLLDTILSRCLRLQFGSGAGVQLSESVVAWLRGLGALWGGSATTVLQRYEMLGGLLARLADLRGQVEEGLRAQSPLDSGLDVDPEMKETWEAELAAAVEAEYRRLRAELLGGLEWLLRDVWMVTLGEGSRSLALPDLRATSEGLARRLNPAQALENLKTLATMTRRLDSTAQEALVLEVGMLKLRL